MKRCALYARVSTRDQSPDLQLDDLRAWAKQRRVEVVGEYVDIGVSGTKVKRPELDRLMKDCHRGQIDLVAVWRFDRFGRSMQHLVTSLNDFSGRNIEFVSLQDGIDTSTAAGRMVFGVLASLAEFERELIRERVVSGLAAAKRRGRSGGRPKVRVDIGQALAQRGAGVPLREIARRLGVGTATVQRALAWHDSQRSTNPSRPASEVVGSVRPGSMLAAVPETGV
jgi:DNA invertase Pin-like site-specific DNA recombinase